MENIHSGMVLYAEKYGLGQSQMFSVLISLQSLKISLRKRMKTSLAKIDNVYMEMPTLLRSVSSHMELGCCQQSFFCCQLLETFIKDLQEKDRLFNAIETIPCISNKAKWCLDRIQRNLLLGKVSFSCCCVRISLHVFGGFYAIIWLKKDEGRHCYFACLLYSLLQKQLPLEKVYQIVLEAVEIETEFVCKALPCDFNWNELKPYEPVTLGCDRRYKAENPFDWMEFISLQQNFFDKRKGEYQKASVMSSLQDGYKNCEFKIDEDF
ncbi:unnamed protein product [Brassica oleracea var. botrytis]|uniref:Uncharacterized protein n=1 Tax=Brassica oleracea TaxID=3712 RepID=A0A3P6F255_BRAOL|nr:unnamed protein product [Brassica oleracea]